MLSFGEVGVVDLEANLFLFPLWWVLSFGEVGVVDLKANLFLTVLSFEKNRCF